MCLCWVVFNYAQGEVYLHSYWRFLSFRQSYRLADNDKWNCVLVYDIEYTEVETFISDMFVYRYLHVCRGADKSLARPTSWCILFDCENISFDASLVVYINITDIL